MGPDKSIYNTRFQINLRSNETFIKFQEIHQVLVVLDGSQFFSKFCEHTPLKNFFFFFKSQPRVWRQCIISSEYMERSFFFSFGKNQFKTYLMLSFLATGTREAMPGPLQPCETNIIWSLKHAAWFRINFSWL